MKKRFLAAALCAVMALALLPATAQAASTVVVAGTTLTAGLYYKNDSSTGITPSGGESEANVWLTANDELHLRGLNVTYHSAETLGGKPGVYGIFADSGITLVLHGSGNQIEVSSPGIVSEDKVYGIYVKARSPSRKAASLARAPSRLKALTRIQAFPQLTVFGPIPALPSIPAL